MAYKPEVKFEAPRGGMLIQAYREEANMFDREEKPHRAKQYRAFADRLQALVDAASKNKKPNA
jgi:hypothetical protein